MEYRRLGRTGLSVSALGFGCGSAGGLFVRGTADEQRAAVSAALEGGVNYFDTAAQYGDGLSERNLGQRLRDLGASPHIGTKLALSRDELAKARDVIDERLRSGLERLDRERVDVCTLHTRIGRGAGELSAGEVLDTVVGAMRSVVERGIAGAIGFSGLGESAELLAVAGSGAFDTFQCYFNVLNQSAATPGSPDGLAQDFEGLLDVGASAGLGAFCIRALAGGALADEEAAHPFARRSSRPMALGEEFAADRERARGLADRLESFGVSSLFELAVRFAVSEPRLSSVLVGFSDHAQVDEALRVTALGPLDTKVLAQLRAEPWRG